MDIDQRWLYICSKSQLKMLIKIINMSEAKKDLPVVLVVCGGTENWFDLCADFTDQFTIEQATWENITLVSYYDKPLVELLPEDHPINERQKNRRVIKPSLVLVRNLFKSIPYKLGRMPNYKNILYGFAHICIPMINGLGAILAESERPLMYGRLKEIKNKLGADAFPLIEQCYFSEQMTIICPPPTPFVLKISYPHAGFGKIRVFDYHEMDDLKNIIAIHNDYCSCEPLIDSKYELRIVYIAPDYYRVHKRTSMSWKVNQGMSAVFEDVEMNERYKLWVDAVKNTYRDMETFAIDAIVDKNGKEFILEVNGSSHGLAPDHCDEDLQHLRSLVISRLNEITGSVVKQEEAADMVEIDKDVQIINLKNKIEDLEQEAQRVSNALESTQSYCSELKGSKKAPTHYIYIIILLIILLISSIIFAFLK